MRRVSPIRGAAAVGRGAKSFFVATGWGAKRLFRINVANTLTLGNGISGFASILVAAQGHYFIASYLILLGVMLDWFDGKAARAFDEVSPLGAELDSLSDMVTFGVAPAALVSFLAPSLLTYFAAGLFVLSAALRLARFNVQQIKGEFFGLPTTTNGMLLPLLVLFSVPLPVFPFYLLIMAFLMNAPVRVAKFL